MADWLNPVSTGMNIAGAAAGITGDLINAFSYKKRRAHQEAREDNAVQRRAADLEKAGFSKTLAAGSPAQASPMQGTPAPQGFGDSLKEGAKGLRESRSLEQQLLVQQAGIMYTNAQKDLIDTQRRFAIDKHSLELEILQNQADAGMFSGSEAYTRYMRDVLGLESDTVELGRKKVQSERELTENKVFQKRWNFYLETGYDPYAQSGIFNQFNQMANLLRQGWEDAIDSLTPDLFPEIKENIKNGAQKLWDNLLNKEGTTLNEANKAVIGFINEQLKKADPASAVGRAINASDTAKKALAPVGR